MEQTTRGILKCNVDAAIFSNPSFAGFGCILRDSQGQITTAMHGKFPGNHSPVTAEALGIREALSWIKGMQLQNVIIESDAQVVVTALNTSNSDLSSFGLILENCRSLAKEISNCSVTFVRRSANQAAHALAKATVSMSVPVGWVYPPLALISDVIATDLS